MFDVLLLVLALCHSSRTTNSGTLLPQRVDRIELNHYWWTAGCESHQVIFWRWSSHEGRYRAERFFFISADGSQNPYRVGGKWRFTHRNRRNANDVSVFETEDLIETVTSYDPWKRAMDTEKQMLSSKE